MSNYLEWHDRDGKVKKFFVSQVWSDIRHQDLKVDWYHMVWFPSGIPRHAINLWLIVRRKFKTQDMIPHWDISNSLGSVCSLCEITPDSYEHLFFEFPFTQGIWNSVKGCTGLDTSPPNIYDIILSLMPTINRRNTINVVAKLVVASSAYYVWQERNWRLFKKDKRTPDQLVKERSRKGQNRIKMGQKREAWRSREM
nr:reverse transcriptase domain, reverse transcriptase zinc-binding domain protein [Tanacetum cinerariifolium]